MYARRPHDIRTYACVADARYIEHGIFFKFVERSTSRRWICTLRASERQSDPGGSISSVPILNQIYSRPSSCSAEPHRLFQTSFKMQRPRPYSRVPVSSSLTYKYSIVLWMPWLFLILSNLAPKSECYGTFELQILEVENVRGEIAGGDCCGTVPRRRRVSAAVRDQSHQSLSPPPRLRQQRLDENQPSFSCFVPCRTYFRVCLREYQSNVSVAAAVSCSYGNVSSPVLGPNSFTLADPDRANGKLSIRFKFGWTKAFTLLLEALDAADSTPTSTGRIVSDTSSGRLSSSGGDDNYGGKLIEKAAYSGIILPSTEWHTLNHHGLTAKIIYRIRVQCDKYYYDYTCMKFCRPRDDKFGHFTCDPHGNKECIAGWQGLNCEKAICKTGCHSEHGKCDYPGDCECRPGWKGEFCDQCQPYPDCRHGYCNAPYECICNTNWGGILCDKDLNYCGTHEPCLNGGTCSNTAPDQYFCACADGFSGAKCEIVTNPCSTTPCRNGSTCVESDRHFHCICLPGWTGTVCDTNINDCASDPCFNGATCVDMVGTYKCLCPINWTGNRCELDVNECDTAKPCVNAVSCQNTRGDYRCECQKGWTGKNCDQNVDDCQLTRCFHGATCIDLVNDYYCVCAPGFTGKECEIDTNECVNNPCKNGGECVDLLNAFRCICPVGFTGDICQVNQEHCNSNPCRNNAQCLNMAEDYYCHCTEKWRGKNCTIPQIECGDGGIIPCNTTAPIAMEAEVNSWSCEPNPCSNGGTCVITENQHVACLCDEEFEGHRCQTRTLAKTATGVNNYCYSSPCFNGGKCVNGTNWFLCICLAGFTGPDCRININECASDPCAYGLTCVDGIANYECLCPAHRAGKTCEIARAENYTNESLNPMAVVMELVVMPAASLITCVGFLLLVYRCRNRCCHSQNVKSVKPFPSADNEDGCGARLSHIRMPLTRKKTQNITTTTAITKDENLNGYINALRNDLMATSARATKLAIVKPAIANSVSITKINVVKPICRQTFDAGAMDVTQTSTTATAAAAPSAIALTAKAETADDNMKTTVVMQNRNACLLPTSTNLFHLLIDSKLRTIAQDTLCSKAINRKTRMATTTVIKHTTDNVPQDAHSQYSTSSSSLINTVLPNVFV